MKYEHFLISLMILTLAFIVGGKTSPTDTARFSIFSSLDESTYELYLRIRKNNPDPSKLDSSQELDLPRKKQICLDIADNFLHYFIPTLRLKIETKIKNPNSLTGEFLVHSTPDGYLRKISKETGFVCAFSERWPGDHHLKLLVSTEYNLNTSSNLPADHLAGRFVYTIKKSKKNLEHPILFGLAEVPAKGISSPDIDVESDYLEKKKKYTAIPDEPTKDPLCGLQLVDKLRICSAVFASPYFKGKLEYPHSRIKNIDQVCKKKTITLRTHVEEEEIPPERKFDEWMLSCARLRSNSEGYSNEKRFAPSFDYYISHAYESNAIFVYFLDKEVGKIFLENLSTKVRINVDVSKFPGVSEIDKDAVARN